MLVLFGKVFESSLDAKAASRRMEVLEGLRDPTNNQRLQRPLNVDGCKQRKVTPVQGGANNAFEKPLV